MTKVYCPNKKENSEFCIGCLHEFPHKEREDCNQGCQITEIRQIENIACKSYVDANNFHFYTPKGGE